MDIWIQSKPILIINCQKQDPLLRGQVGTMVVSKIDFYVQYC